MNSKEEKTAQELLEDEYFESLQPYFDCYYKGDEPIPSIEVMEVAENSANLSKYIAIEFVSWIAKHIYPYEIIANSTEELFEIFIKEKYKN